MITLLFILLLVLATAFSGVAAQPSASYKHTATSKRCWGNIIPWAPTITLVAQTRPLVAGIGCAPRVVLVPQMANQRTW
jgi:hypothetical protein